MKKLFACLSALITFAVVSYSCVYHKTDKIIQEEWPKKSKEDLLETNKKDELIKEQEKRNNALNSKISNLIKKQFKKFKSKLQTKSEEINKLKIDLAKIKEEVELRKSSILEVDAAELAASVANLTTRLEICMQEKNELIGRI